MKSLDIVKKELLRRKINEHIAKNPTIKEFVVRARFADDNTFWKVRREGKDFNIIEVNTRKEVFILSERSLREEEPKKDKKKKKNADDLETNVEPEPQGASPEPGGEPETGGLETDGDSAMPDEEPETGEMPPEEPETQQQPEPERMETGEEMQLKQLVDNKPVQDIKIEPTDTGGIISLTLGSMENPLEITFERGQASYSVGDLSRRLPSAKTK